MAKTFIFHGFGGSWKEQLYKFQLRNRQSNNLRAFWRLDPDPSKVGVMLTHTWAKKKPRGEKT